MHFHFTFMCTCNRHIWENKLNKVFNLSCTRLQMVWGNVLLLQTLLRPHSLWMESCLSWIQDTANLRYSMATLYIYIHIFPHCNFWKAIIPCTSLHQSDTIFYSLFSLNRFSILALEWMLYRFIPSARLMPTSVLAEQDVQDQGSVTGNGAWPLSAYACICEHSHNWYWARNWWTVSSHAIFRFLQGWRIAGTDIILYLSSHSANRCKLEAG